MVKYVFVTGGVVSGLGKGITAASLGRLLKARGCQVTMQKFDPYINIDPGTMNPIQHGEVFVTEDGTETDLDLGHYERFIDENLDKNSNVTTGKIYWSVLLFMKPLLPWKERDWQMWYWKVSEWKTENRSFVTGKRWWQISGIRKRR